MEKASGAKHQLNQELQQMNTLAITETIRNGAKESSDGLRAIYIVVIFEKTSAAVMEK